MCFYEKQTRSSDNKNISALKIDIMTLPASLDMRAQLIFFLEKSKDSHLLTEKFKEDLRKKLPAGLTQENIKGVFETYQISASANDAWKFVMKELTTKATLDTTDGKAGFFKKHWERESVLMPQAAFFQHANVLIDTVVARNCCDQQNPFVFTINHPILSVALGLVIQQRGLQNTIQLSKSSKKPTEAQINIMNIANNQNVNKQLNDKELQNALTVQSDVDYQVNALSNAVNNPKTALKSSKRSVDDDKQDMPLVKRARH